METFALVSVCVFGHCSISLFQGTGTTCSTPRSRRRKCKDSNIPMTVNQELLLEHETRTKALQ